MNLLGKIVTGHVPDNAPSTAVQICYLNYVDKTCCGAKMTKTYNLNMLKIKKLFETAINRNLTSDNFSLIQHEIWHYETLNRILGDSAPYSTNNINELTIYEWKLQSSIAAAFIFNKIRFDIVTVIIENQMEHWFGIKQSSNPVYTYQRSRPRPRSLLTVECFEIPQSPIVLAANNPKYTIKCGDCGECNQIVMPMETYYFKKVCANGVKKEQDVEPAHECKERQKPKSFSVKFCVKNLFQRDSTSR